MEQGRAESHMNDYENNRTTESEEPFELCERKRWAFFGLPFTFTTYTLSNKKLTLRTGLLTTVEDDVLLYRIMDTTYRRTLVQRLFGLGTIVVASSDHSKPELIIKNIRNSKDFKEALDDQIEHERLRMRFRTGEYMGTNDEDGDGVPDFL